MKQYDLLDCRKCVWYIKGDKAKDDYCMHYNTDLVNVVGTCTGFKAKLYKRDCTKCIHYNKRKNATTKCKIGIYNCKGVIRNEVDKQ